MIETILVVDVAMAAIRARHSEVLQTFSVTDPGIFLLRQCCTYSLESLENYLHTEKNSCIKKNV